MIRSNFLVRILWRYGIVFVCVTLIGVTAALSVTIRDFDQGIGFTSPLGDFKFTASLGFYHFRHFDNPRDWGVARIHGNAFQYPEFNEIQNQSLTPRFFVLRDHSLKNFGMTIRYGQTIILLGLVAIGSLGWIFFKRRGERLCR